MTLLNRIIGPVAILTLAAGGDSLAGQGPAAPGETNSSSTRRQTPSLQSIVQRSPRLPIRAVELRPESRTPGSELGMVSWVAVGPTADIYLLQRGDKADPIVVMNRDGKVLRSWGKGLFTLPHAIRLDPKGNVWTTDAATSMVYQFSPMGDKLMEIAVGGQPSPCLDQMTASNPSKPRTANNFCGTTDIAFAPNGHLFVTDGYANNRVLEFGADGKRIKEWGSAGTGPGQFHLPHSIEIDDRGVIYIADRENGRIQRFDLDGKYLGEWGNLGRVYSLQAIGDALWLATQPLELPTGSPGWILKLDRKTGQLLGHADITAGHGLDLIGADEVVVGPGPTLGAIQWFRRTPP